MRVHYRWVASIDQSWDSWYLEFEIRYGDLEKPAAMRPSDIRVLEECWFRGLTPDEALENVMEWT